MEKYNSNMTLVMMKLGTHKQTLERGEMAKVEANQAQAQFAELISRVEDHQERIVIEQAGQAVAAVISYADLQRFEALEDALDAEFVRRAKAENPEFVNLEQVVEGYNQQHGTNLTLESLLND